MLNAEKKTMHNISRGGWINRAGKAEIVCYSPLDSNSQIFIEMTSKSLKHSLFQRSTHWISSPTSEGSSKDGLSLVVSQRGGALVWARDQNMRVVLVGFGSKLGSFSSDGLETGLDASYRATRVTGFALQEVETRVLLQNCIR